MTRHEYRHDHGHGHTRWTRWDSCAFGHPVLLAERLLDQDSNEQENGDNNDQRRCHNTRFRSRSGPHRTITAESIQKNAGLREGQERKPFTKDYYCSSIKPPPFHLYETLPRPTALPPYQPTALPTYQARDALLLAENQPHTPHQFITQRRPLETRTPTACK